jgi:C-terminal processing protease CtpA/Prc
MTVATDAAMLVELVIEQLNERYVFPERAEDAAALLRSRLGEGAYGAADGAELCARISQDLFAASEDKHLRLLWHDEPALSGNEERLVEELREQIRRENHGVRRVVCLESNVGLIDLTIVGEAATGGPTFAAAIQLVEHTRALVLDLRETRGGAPDGVLLLESFLLGGDVHVGDIVEGPKGPVRQQRTYSYLPAPCYLDRPVYVLTSGSTFSGGEALAYDLQALGRATVVGETTRGGAHPSAVVWLRQQIELRLPVARPVSAATGTNWEGSGVRPDIPVPADGALGAALAALG